MAVIAKLRVGERAPAFTLKGVDEKYYTLDNFASKQILVVIFSCNHCPYVKAYEDRILAIQQDYADRGVQVVAINSNDATNYPEDSFDQMCARARSKGFPFPYLYDETQQVARAYGAERTPHVFVFDKMRRLKYKGTIDDNWENPSMVKKHYLREAIDVLLNGQPIPQPETMAVGCSVKWRS